MLKCQITQKATTFGKNVSHAKNRTSRTFKSNVHSHTIRVQNFPTCKVKISRKGLRILDKISASISYQHYRTILKVTPDKDHGKEKNQV